MRLAAKIMLTLIALFAVTLDPGQAITMIHDVWEK